MSEIVIVNEKYLSEYYSKREQVNKLKYELEEMSENIKISLETNKTPLGKTYGNYVASIVVKNKLNSNFIQMLKNNNMQNRIVEVCYIKDCKDIVSNFTDKDKENYYGIWYKQLIVRKK